MRTLAAVPLAALLHTVGCSGRAEPPVLHLLPVGAEETALTLGDISRMGFGSPSGHEWTVTFTIHQSHARLGLACGIPPVRGARAYREGHFRADLVVDGDTVVVFRESARPGKWQEGVVDLTPWTGQQVRLVLRADSEGGSDDDVCYWSTPLVVGPVGERPNVLLISIDSLRADHLGCYGYPKPTSPSIDSLASVGCLFTNAIAQSSWTLQSYASLFTSLYVRSHRVYDLDSMMSPGACTLAQLLRQAGYVTAAVVAAPWLSPAFGLDQGFDVYDTACLQAGGHHNITGMTNRCVHARATRLLERWSTAPFFLLLQYFDVHYDYEPPPPYDTMFDPDYQGMMNGKRFIDDERIAPGLAQRDLEHLVALYDGEIAHTDRYLGMIFRELRRLHLAANTLVIVTSDHGDEFLEHDGKGHGRTLFQEVVHVPLVWSEPGDTSGPDTVSQMVQLIDIAPTILEYLGVGIPATMEGKSFLAALRGEPMEERPAFSELPTSPRFPDVNLTAVIAGRLKMIHSPTDLWTTAYDLSKDPDESCPLVPNSIPAGPELQEALVSFGGDAGQASEAGQAGRAPRRGQLEEGLRRQLAELGYLQ